MDKKKILLLALLLVAVSSQSQIKFGAVVGANNSFFTEGVAQGFYIEPSVGLQVGAFAEIGLSKSIYFRPKLVYSEQGDRHKTDITDYSSIAINTLDYKLSYLNVPLDFKFGNKVYAVAGPQIGWVIADKRQNLFVSSVKSGFDVGANLGLGFKANRFFAEVGAYQGFITVYKYYYANTGNLVNVKNGCFKLSLGYYFN